jgi:hypothetical protein
VSHMGSDCCVADLPRFEATSVLLSICGSAPFGGVADQNLSVAYISAFLLVFMVCAYRLSMSTVLTYN